MSGRPAPAFLVALALAAAAARAEDRPALEFHRVHVPADRLGDVPLGPGRYVPMPLADFESAVARARAVIDATAAPEPAPPATSARWRAGVDESGRLVGTLSIDVGPATAGPGRVLPLGNLRVIRGVVAAEPPREATICGLGAGVAVAIPQAGRYELEVACAPAAAAVFRLPLVPALATTFGLDLAPGLRPVLSGPAARHAIVAAPAAGTTGPWKIDLGPAAELTITIEPRDRPPPAVAVWGDVELSGPRATVIATVVPAAPWRAGRLTLEQDPALRVTGIHAAGDEEALDHEAAGDGRTITVTVPRWLDGARTPLVVRGVTPATGPVWRLPLLRAGGNGWAGGGSVVRVDPAFAVRDLDLEDCRVVPPATAANWPVAAAPDAAAPVRPAATYHVEQQGPASALGIVLGPRTASFDVARVTTVDITPGAVLGRAACDVRVVGGEAFEIAARVAPGWIIDAVDAVDWETAPGPTRGPADDRALDWRVAPSPVGDTLRIGLTSGATGPRGVGLRIAGHRAGLAPGAAFTTADIDMVRFDGEAADAAVIDLRTAADAFVEIAGRPAGWFEVTGRLAALVEEGKGRGRIRGGDRAGDTEARVVRRRPPLDVRVDVRLEPRADVLAQTFTFDCRADAGVESLVVDFGKPGGDGLAWSVESPAGIGVTARPLDPAEGGLASRSDAVAASWIVELSPAATGAVRIRAVRSVPFTGPEPVPLAWVEGAVEPGGSVVVAAPPGGRPRLANRSLRELPTDPAATSAPAEFAYGAPQAGIAAELIPARDGADARAWAWRETVECWCDESGATASESRFDLENEGRAVLTLALAPGRRLEGVSVGGARVPDLEFGTAGGTWRIPLPAGRRRLDVVVRTLAAGRPGRGAWRVDPAVCSLDVPVLERDVRLLVPPDLVVAMPGAGPGASWAARLFGTGTADDRPAGVAGSTGYRGVRVTAAGDRGRGVLVLSRRRLAGGACLAAVVVGWFAYVRGRRRPASACLVVAGAAVAALWLSVAFMPVARAAWWGGLVGLACALVPAVRAPRRRPWWPGRAAVAAACACAVLAACRPAAAADADVRVFVTSGTGGATALVPEPLFRALAAHAAGESAAIRVLACRITGVAVDAGREWQVSLDVDADSGGTLAMDTGPGGRWLPPRAAVAGIDVRIEGREARLTATAPGRQTVDLALVPAVERRGPVEIATASIPVAPSAWLRLADDAQAGSIACERSVGGAPFLRVAAAGRAGGAAFDVSVSDRVRIARPVDPRDRLLDVVRIAETVNELAWHDGGCDVEAVFDLDAEADLVRSFVVRADPRLEALAAESDAGPPRLELLDAGRIRVELPEAVRGAVRVRLKARLPLADPVGVFDAPGLWLEGVAAEQRTTRLASTTEFEALLDPPPAAAATAADLAGRPPTRVIVRRRRAQLRGAQMLAVAFAPTGTGLALEAQIDATGYPLTRIPIDVPVGAEVDRVVLLADEPAEAGGREAIDIEWTRTAADRVLVVVQRPRPGRYRLEVEARLARRPAARGRLPMVRARLGAAVPLLVSWTAEPSLTVTIGAGPAPGRGDTLEVPDGAPEPEYEVTTSAAPTPEPPPAAPPAAEDSRLECAEVRAAFDARGRVHGLARFDIVTPAASVRLRLPPGMRLFDVLVDGRVAAAEPRAVDAWDVPLAPAAWPRSILAVFAGDVGSALAAGRPFEMAAPRLEGFPAAEVLWSLRPPAGFSLAVEAPARRLGDAALAAALVAVNERITATCTRVAAGLAAPERERLEALAALRRAGGGLVAEGEWWRAAGWDDAEQAAIGAASAEPLVIRAVPENDATTPARTAATIALVAVAGLAWTAATRGRGARG